MSELYIENVLGRMRTMDYLEKLLMLIALISILCVNGE